jgi:hypothetical protein
VRSVAIAHFASVQSNSLQLNGMPITMVVAQRNLLMLLSTADAVSREFIACT